MKIDKNNPLHWLALVWSGVLLVLSLPARLFSRRRPQTPYKVVFYGHRLNGNLLALYRNWSKRKDVECYFLSFDSPRQTNLVRTDGFRVLDALSLSDTIKLATSDVIISSHGLHHFVLLRKLTSIKFVDVFHTPLAYKGFDADDFGHLHAHDETWVSSEKVKKIYEKKYGFEKNKIKVTGCARVDDIKTYQKTAKAIKKKYGLDLHKKTILIAPTWKQDDQSGSIVPFGMTLHDFMKAVLAAAKKDDVQVVFRAHLNIGDMIQIDGLENIHTMPYSQYPNAEEFIAISDVLINDWSSIAIDFMTTNNPVVYLDVPAPFAKGFSAGPKNRVGAVVKNGQELTVALKEALYSPNKYQKKYAEKIENTKNLVFGNTLDGLTFERCDNALFELLNVTKS